MPVGAGGTASLAAGLSTFIVSPKKEGNVLFTVVLVWLSAGVRGMKKSAAGIMASSVRMLIKTRGERKLKIERRARGLTVPCLAAGSVLRSPALSPELSSRVAALSLAR